MTPTPLRSAEGLRLERFFALHERRARHLLCTSDVEPLRLAELLELARPETRELWDGLALGYTEPGGMEALRAEIAALYDGVEPDEVLTFAGAEEAIFVSLHALLGPGDHAVVTWPGYQALQDVAAGTGADVTLLPLDEANGWALDPDDLRRAIRPTTRAVIVNFPHNPTGAVPDRGSFEAIAAIAAEVGACLFSDEVYRELEHDPADRLPAAVGFGGRAASVGVMSKAFGLAGLRIGWLASADHELLRRTATFKELVSSGCSAPSELLALIGLQAREALLDRSRSILAANLELLDAFLAEWEGVFDWVRPRAGCVGFPRLDAAHDVEELAAGLVEQEGVLLVPGSVYDHPGNHFRIGFGHSDFAVGLAGLDRYARRELRGSGR